MSAGAIVSVEAYVHDYVYGGTKPACEYFDGVLRPKSLGTRNHGHIQYRSCELIRALGYEALPEITVRLSEKKFLIPDVAVDRKIESPYHTHPIPLVIEVLSPPDRVRDLLAKCELYHAWGVECCWVIDPDEEIGWVYPRGSAPVRVERSGQLSAGDIVVSMDELFG
jgi:Uma2 family endonuclease